MVKGLESTEAHSYYLREFVESGVFGILAFAWLLTKIISLSASVHKNSRLVVSKTIGGVTLAVTIALSIIALVQDAFTPVVFNELWWVLIGLTMAAYRIEGVHNRELDRVTSFQVFRGHAYLRR